MIDRYDLGTRCLPRLIRIVDVENDFEDRAHSTFRIAVATISVGE